MSASKPWTLPPPSVEDAENAERAESAALLTETTNNLSLGQWAGARLSLRALHARDSGAALRLLEVLARLGPLPGWLASDALPSPAHVSWLAAGEHRSLVRICVCAPRASHVEYCCWGVRLCLISSLSQL